MIVESFGLVLPTLSLLCLIENANSAGFTFDTRHPSVNFVNSFTLLSTIIRKHSHRFHQQSSNIMTTTKLRFRIVRKKLGLRYIFNIHLYIIFFRKSERYPGNTSVYTCTDDRPYFAAREDNGRVAPMDGTVGEERGI